MIRDSMKGTDWDSALIGISGYRETIDLRKQLYFNDDDGKLEHDKIWDTFQDELDTQAHAFFACLTTEPDSPARNACTNQTDNMLEVIQSYFDMLKILAQERGIGNAQEKLKDLHKVLDLWAQIYGPRKACFNPLILSELSIMEAEWTVEAIPSIQPDAIQCTDPGRIAYRKLVAYKNREFLEWGTLFAKEPPAYQGSNERARAAYAYIRSVYLLSSDYIDRAALRAEDTSQLTHAFWRTREEDLVRKTLAIGVRAHKGLERVLVNNEIHRLRK